MLVFKVFSRMELA